MTAPSAHTAPPPGARVAPAAARNREPILTVMREEMPASGVVVEIAAGSGEHAVAFSNAFPALTWRPTDGDETALASIEAWRAAAGPANMAAALRLDAGDPGSWPIDAADAVVCINMIHISPWTATVGLMAGAGRILPAGGLLFAYGPYIQAGVETASSNLAFDLDLKARNPAWGLRKLDDVVALAEQNGLMLSRTVSMPANNLSLVFRRR